MFKKVYNTFEFDNKTSGVTVPHCYSCEQPGRLYLCLLVDAVIELFRKFFILNRGKGANGVDFVIGLPIFSVGVSFLDFVRRRFFAAIFKYYGCPTGMYR